MLERVDRMQLAVRDRTRAAGTFTRLLGAELAREADSEALNARRTILALGESELELCEPRGSGPAQEFIDRWGEGLLAAGFATSRLAELWEAGGRLNPSADPHRCRSSPYSLKKPGILRPFRSL